mgnify:CR=1 FL=1
MHSKIVFVNGYGIFAGHRRPGKVLEFCDGLTVVLEMVDPRFLEDDSDVDAQLTYKMPFSLDTGRAAAGCGFHAIAGEYGWQLWGGDLVELRDYLDSPS